MDDETLVYDEHEDDIDNSEETNDTDETTGQEGESAEDNSNADSGENEDEVNSSTDVSDQEGDDDSDEDNSDDNSDNSDESNDVTIEDTKAWQKRVERAKRSMERDFLAEVNSLSDGVTIERKEIPQATRLWNLLKANPQLNRDVTNIIDKVNREGKLTDLRAYASNPLNQNVQRNSDATEDRMELYEARLDLKFSDPVFKKYESEVMKWAEDNDFPIKSKKNLDVAYKAWKGENSSKLVAHVEAKTKKKANEVKKQKKDAKLMNKKVSAVKGKSLDYRKASDREILEAEGLSLFQDD
jgi:hypothetical protein